MFPDIATRRSYPDLQASTTYNIGGVTKQQHYFAIIIQSYHKQWRELLGCKKSYVSHEHRARVIIRESEKRELRDRIARYPYDNVLFFDNCQIIPKKKEVDGRCFRRPFRFARREKRCRAVTHDRISAHVYESRCNVDDGPRV